MPTAWTRHELSLTELLGLDFEGATSRFRSSGPTALVTSLGDKLPARLKVVNLLSPAGTLSWSAPPPEGLAAWQVPEDPAWRAAAKKELGAALRRLGHPPAKGWLQEVLSQLGLVKAGPADALSLCSQLPQWREIGRRIACVVPDHALEAFFEWQDAALRELGAFAFLPAAEDVVLLRDSTPIGLHDEVLHGVSPISYARSQPEWHQRNEALLVLIREVIAAVERGAPVPPDMSPGRVINRVIHLQMPPPGSWQRLHEQTLRELLSHRARLVRLLGWPSHLRAVRQALHPDFGLPGIDTHGATSPYDAGTELRAYLDEMSRHYSLTVEAAG